ncbi:DUF433 domain-containing protein [Patescibacteria group bacterium]|nr:DUF433 domain-containing protein [Patescibacteria group bacterium]
MKYLESKEGIANGELVLKGTRIRVTQLIRMLLSGRTVDQIHTDSWPWISERKLHGAVEEAMEQMSIAAIHGKASL